VAETAQQQTWASPRATASPASGTSSDDIFWWRMRRRMTPNDWSAVLPLCMGRSVGGAKSFLMASTIFLISDAARSHAISPLTSAKLFSAPPQTASMSIGALPAVAGSTAASNELIVPSLRLGPPTLVPRSLERKVMPRASSLTRWL